MLNNLWKHLRAIVLLPGMVTIIIPAIIYRNGLATFADSLPAVLVLLVRLLGVILFAPGLFLIFKTASLFATQGRGTLAPWDPPQKLVVQGIYRHVRNPMISGVCTILLGEALLLTSLSLLIWCVVVVLINAVYIPLVEEPGLGQRFGDDYLNYKRNVPRWLPRLRPWTG